MIPLFHFHSTAGKKDAEKTNIFYLQLMGNKEVGSHTVSIGSLALLSTRATGIEM